MTFSNRNSLTVVVAITAAFFCIASAQAGKPDKPGGGKGGEGGGGSEAELELLELDQGGSVYDINNSGMMVGNVNGIAGTWYAYDTVPTFLPLSSSGFGGAHAVNESGEIVGITSAGPSYWSSYEADPINLPLPQGFDGGVANGISNNGIVVGAVSSQGAYAAVAWRVNGNSVFGPILLSSSNDSGANDVASLGSGVTRVVGEDKHPDGLNVATTWDLNLLPDGTFAVIESTFLFSDQWSRVNAITESGDMAGIVADTTGNDLDWPDTAFVIRDSSLDLLPSGKRNNFSEAMDLNETDVIGSTGRTWQPDDAAQWNSRGRLDNLATYFGDNWSQTDARGINDLGDIVGSGSMVDSETTTAWLLRHPLVTSASAITIPEPSTITLLILGTTVLATRRRK